MICDPPKGRQVYSLLHMAGTIDGIDMAVNEWDPTLL